MNILIVSTTGYGIAATLTEALQNYATNNSHRTQPHTITINIAPKHAHWDNITNLDGQITGDMITDNGKLPSSENTQINMSIVIKHTHTRTWIENHFDPKKEEQTQHIINLLSNI